MIKQIGSTVQEQRRKANFTVLTHKVRSWEPGEVGTLRNELFTHVRTCTEHPSALIIDGHLEKDEIVELLNLTLDTFDHQVVVGVENSALPFMPSNCQ